MRSTDTPTEALKYDPATFGPGDAAALAQETEHRYAVLDSAGEILTTDTMAGAFGQFALIPDAVSIECVPCQAAGCFCQTAAPVTTRHNSAAPAEPTRDYDVLTGPVGWTVPDPAPECPECCRTLPVHSYGCTRRPE